MRFDDGLFDGFLTSSCNSLFMACSSNDGDWLGRLGHGSPHGVIELDVQIIPMVRAMSFFYYRCVWVLGCAMNCTLPTH